MRIALRQDHHHVIAEVQPERGGYRVGMDGEERFVEVHSLDETSLVLTVDGRQYRVDLVRNGRERWVAIAGEVYTFVPEGGAVSAHSVATVAPPEVTAPMPGKVLQVLVQAGDRVAAGDGLLILEAMKMETRMVAEAAGIVAEVRVAAGDMVDGRQVLVVLAYDGEPASA